MRLDFGFRCEVICEGLKRVFNFDPVLVRERECVVVMVAFWTEPGTVRRLKDSVSRIGNRGTFRVDTKRTFITYDAAVLTINHRTTNTTVS